MSWLNKTKEKGRGVCPQAFSLELWGSQIYLTGMATDSVTSAACSAWRLASK